jgi:hypothetical protein
MAIDIDGNGLIALGGTSTTQGRVRLAEDTDNGTNYIELTAPASVASNRTVTFPDETGTVITTATTTGLNASAISTGTLAVARGGTGATTLTAENVILGNTTSAVKFVAPGTSGNVLTSNGTTWLSQAASSGSGSVVAWVNFNGQSTVSIRASGNVNSITDNSTGDYTINFATALTDANYCLTFGGTGNSSNSASSVFGGGIRNDTAPTANAIRFVTGSSGNAGGYPQDPLIVNATIVR